MTNRQVNAGLELHQYLHNDLQLLTAELDAAARWRVT
jgi:hypothetical protein